MSATDRPLVILESPYAAPRDVGLSEAEKLDMIERNKRYARACLKDSLRRGEAPIASHLLYTQPGVLNDDIPEERTRGIEAGLAWRAVAQKTVVYTDLGISFGMQYGIEAAMKSGLPVEKRELPAAELKNAVDGSSKMELLLEDWRRSTLSAQEIAKQNIDKGDLETKKVLVTSFGLAGFEITFNEEDPELGTRVTVEFDRGLPQMIVAPSDGSDPIARIQIGPDMLVVEPCQNDGPRVGIDAEGRSGFIELTDKEVPERIKAAARERNLSIAP
jgi:hypothetical protein